MVTIKLDDKTGKRIETRAQKKGVSVEEYVFFLVQSAELWEDVEEALSERSIPLSSASQLLSI